jgi:hypothetical protein
VWRSIESREALDILPRLRCFLIRQKFAFRSAPAVDKVDLIAYPGQIGDEIVIRAHDDFEVIDVTVAIANASGQAIDAAVETPPQSGHWIYTAKHVIKQ